MGFLMSLTLPAGQRLFVRRDAEEVELILKPGADTDFGVLAFKPGSLRARARSIPRCARACSSRHSARRITSATPIARSR